VQMHFVCGSFNCWAIDNREAALRVCEGAAKVKGAKHCSNFEIKCVDGTCNPYYALAGIITAGLDGLRQNMTLPPPLKGDPEKQNIPSLPVEFDDAVKQFGENSALLEMFGAANLAKLVTIRKAEQQYFKDKSVEFCKRATIDHF
jgi:glutamine synthetase